MIESVIAHRFQRLHPLGAGEEPCLYSARDVATDAPGTLLQIGTPGADQSEVAVRFRLAAFAAQPLFRPFPPRVVLRGEGSLYLFLPEAAGEPWEPRLLSLPAAAALAEIECLMDGLGALARARCPGGALHISAMWRDDQGPYFLPDSYALPPILRGLDPAADQHDDPVAGAAEVGALFAELAEACGRYRRAAGARLSASDLVDLECVLQALTLARVGGAADDALPGPVRQALAHLQQEGGALLLRGGRAAVRGALDSVRAWAREQKRSYVTLRPHVGPPTHTLSSPSEEPVGRVVVLDQLERYAGFAEGLARLAAAGWLDGREIVVVAPSASPLDGAADLYLASLRHRGSERLHEVTLPEDAAPPQRRHAAARAPQQPSATAGAALRVLEALAVCGRPLSETLLRSTFALTEESVAAIADDLWRARRATVLYARADEAPAHPQLILALAPGAPVEVPPERAAEISALLGGTLELLSARTGLGGDWLRLQAALLRAPLRAPSLVRKLAARARQEDAPLLEYAAYERLLQAADVARPKLEDRCQAAKSMGEQHRLHGDLDRADRIFSEALAAVESSTELAQGRLAPLAAELLLKIAFLAQHRANYRDAHRLLAEGLERYEDQLPVIHRGHIYLDLASALLKLGRTRDAASYCELTLKILDDKRYPLEVARAYNALGLIQYEESNYSQSLINLQRGLVLREQAGLVQEVARSYNNLSLAYRGLGRLEEAERCLKRSLELKTKLGDTLGVAATQLNLGYLAIDQSNFGQANRCGLECLHLARRLRHRQMEAEAHGLLGEAAMGEGRLDEARDLLIRDLEICRATNHETERLATLRRFVALLLRLGEHKEAASRLAEAKEVLEQVPSRFESAMLETLEAELLGGAGQSERAVELLRSAARTLAALRRFDLQLESLARRGTLELAAGRQAEARASLIEARDLMARHEVYRFPAALGDLEQRIGEQIPAPGLARVGAEQQLTALADLLGAGGDLEARRFEGALRALAAGLGCEEVRWVRAARTLGLVRGEIRTSPPPGDLSTALARAEAERAADVLQQGPWTAVRTRGSDPGWLALLRDRPLEEGELVFLQAVAGAVSLATGLSAPLSGHATATQAAPSPGARYGIIGTSTATDAVLRMVDLVKDNDITLLLLGENGTGKDLVARAIHEASARRKGEFVAVNCASIPANLLESELFGHEKGAFTDAIDRHVGMFERADGGTIFLDEIAEMPMAMQAKLLRVLQEKSFTRVGGVRTVRTNARVIAATNRDLEGEVEAGRFRMDLFYRLNVISIQIPPLRDRPQDIKPLVEHFLRRYAEEFRSPERTMSEEAIARLMEYRWPGNVRELENVVKNAMVFAGRDVIRVEDLPATVLGTSGAPTRQSVSDAVRAMVDAEDYSEERPLMPQLEILMAHEVVLAVRNKARAARLLGITKPTLYNRLRRFYALFGSRPLEHADPEADDEAPPGAVRARRAGPG